MIVFLRLLLIALIAWVLYKFLWRNEPTKRRPGDPAPRGHGALEEMKQDPQCGTWLPASQALTAIVAGETRFFCSPECRDKFRQTHPPGQV